MKQKKISKANKINADEDNVRYMINANYFHKKDRNIGKKKAVRFKIADDETVAYKLPVLNETQKIGKNVKKPKGKKVRFWNKQKSKTKDQDITINGVISNRRSLTKASSSINDKKSSKLPVRVSKKVSFLPKPIFSDNHIPMVTVPDDLTIHLNEQEANDLGEDLQNDVSNRAVVRNSKNKSINTADSHTTKSLEISHYRIVRNDSEFEFFSKYVVQKLRKMETNQRIYSENLINTVLMMGQLGHLNGKSKVINQ